MDSALQSNQIESVMQTISQNHALLVKIGVVPVAVQSFITDIQHIGGAAKICGAGSIAGNKAGVVLVVTQDEAALKELCSQYHYNILPVTGEKRGVHVV